MAEKLEDGERLHIGLGFAGTVKDGIVVSSPNNRFLKNYNPARALGRTIKVDNDARAFARAEYRLGAGKGARRALFFTFGTANIFVILSSFISFSLTFVLYVSFKRVILNINLYSLIALFTDSVFFSVNQLITRAGRLLTFRTNQHHV